MVARAKVLIHTHASKRRRRRGAARRPLARLETNCWFGSRRGRRRRRRSQHDDALHHIDLSQSGIKSGRSTLNGRTGGGNGLLAVISVNIIIIRWGQGEIFKRERALVYSATK
ncbi:hypothetical protein Zmor_009261 [Zophobas morio]|uniref:Uncharacterized protein n=1 Tax=Zophobas morio TaxID=2755281 RepID=A0AA38IKP6_9CUCU|nr:hypothetical protein Zmor_009261 [Zophobas morio]